MKKIKKSLSWDKHFSMKWFLIYGVVCSVVAYIYFLNPIIAMSCFLVGILMERSTAADRLKKTKREQLKNFREFIDLVNGSMNVANKAIEVCVDEALDSMERQHIDKSQVYKELKVLQSNLKTSNQSSFKAELIRLAERLGNEEIMNFAHSVSACYGINNQGIAAIIRNTSTLIQEKIKIEDEIYSAIAEAKNQSIIMLAMPSGMLLLLRGNMPSFLNGIYDNMGGVVTYALCLAINYAMFLVIQKIVREGV